MIGGPCLSLWAEPEPVPGNVEQKPVVKPKIKHFIPSPKQEIIAGF
jgi:hypothetical protein